MDKKIVVAIMLVFIWAMFIFIMSDLDSDESNGKSKTIVTDIVDKLDKITNASDDTIKKHKSFEYIENINYLFRKICHASVYLALSVLVFNLVIHIMKKKVYIYSIITLVFCFIYACTDEYHQTFVLGRSGEFTDVLIDTLGALIGCILISIVYIIVKNRQTKKSLNYQEI